MSEEKKPWDRQDGETNRAYNAFLTYRNMGPIRSLPRAAEIFYRLDKVSKTSAKLKQFWRWSSANSWVARCEAWDAEQNSAWQLEQRESIKQMNKRQATYGETMAKVGMSNVLVLSGIEEKGKASFSLEESRRLLETGTRVERVARGEVTEAIQHKGKLGIKVIEIREQNRED